MYNFLLKSKVKNHLSGVMSLCDFSFVFRFSCYDTEMRTEAGGCLVNLLKDAKVQKKPECRAFLQRRSSEVLLCPDKEIRTFLVHFLSKNQNLQHDLPEDLHIKHLSSMYRTPTLEINQTIISQSSGCFVKHGMFQRKKVAVKVLFVKKQHLLENNPSTHARERLIREADCLRLLNESRHPNIPVLLGYDTKSLPYHLITAFEKWGNLLQFVRRSRENSPHLQPVQLLRMLIHIADALLYIEKLGLVHRAVMAANVLVGDSYVCKLSGMQSLEQLTNQSKTPECMITIIVRLMKVKLFELPGKQMQGIFRGLIEFGQEALSVNNSTNDLVKEQYSCH